MQSDLFAKAKAFRDANTFEVNSYDELKEKAGKGFLLAHWNGDAKVEARIKEETKLTIRNRPFSLKQEPGKCVVTGDPSQVDLPGNVTSGLADAVRKLQGVSAMGYQDIRDMVGLEKQRQMLGCEEDLACLAGRYV
jgi:hypothetical protein